MDILKNENVSHANKKLREIFETLRVNAKLENVHHLRKFTVNFTKLRLTMARFQVSEIQN